MLISPRQLGRLQTLYAQLARHEIGLGTGREDRIAWAADRLRKPVKSFKELSSSDAGFLIDGIQQQLGVKAPSSPRKRLDRDQARRAGVDGRKDGGEFAAAPQIASAEDLALIEWYYSRLGWDRARFNAWLGSQRSPLKRKAQPTIATTADANRVRWALMRMLKHAGLWQERRPA